MSVEYLGGGYNVVRLGDVHQEFYENLIRAAYEARRSTGLRHSECRVSYKWDEQTALVSLGTPDALRGFEAACERLDLDQISDLTVEKIKANRTADGLGEYEDRPMPKE